MKFSLRHCSATLLVITIVAIVAIIPTSNAYAADINITSCAQLDAIDQNSGIGANDNYFLENDIVCSDFESLSWNDAFSGTFDGQGHRILGLDITNPDGINVALFSLTNNATFRDLYLDAGNVSGEYSVAALIAVANGNTVIDNVHSSLNVDGLVEVGGLVAQLYGEISDSSITNSSSTGNVSGQMFVGGLVGRVWGYGDADFVIDKSWATGDVQSALSVDPGIGVGGLIGAMELHDSEGASDAIISNSYASGNVSSENISGVGGLIGAIDLDSSSDPITTTISNTYATGDVQGTDAGGLIGSIGNFELTGISITVENSLALGAVSGSGGVGGLIGFQEGSIIDPTLTNNYFDTALTGQDGCVGSDTRTGCTGRALDPELYLGTFELSPMSEWDPNGEPWFLDYGSLPKLSNDVDHDGILNEVENSGDSFNDANNDGIRDSEQQNVTSLVNPLTGNYITLVSEPGTVIIEQSTEDGSEFGVDPGFEYPAGFLNFTLFVGLGNIADIDIYYGDANFEQDVEVRKFNTQTQSFYAVDVDVNEIVEISSTLIRHIGYSAQDGGENDDDVSENGYIVDPIGIGVVPTAVPSTPVTTTVISPNVNAASGSLPSTGSSATMPLVWSGLMVLILGIGLALLRRRDVSTNTKL